MAVRFVKFDESSYISNDCLPLRSVLQKRYLVGKKIDENGEGFGYIGYDIISKSPIYIREFFPRNLAFRNENNVLVNVIDGYNEIFLKCLKEFLFFSRSIAQLREISAIVPIFDIFEENETAYTVSEWEDNITLTEYISRSGGKLDWNIARPLFMPVLSSLNKLANANIHHLGINPDNLVIVKSGKMKIKGFSIPSVRKEGTDLEAELFPVCTAIEQYLYMENIGEVTDVYGFTASLFYALTGIMPQDSIKRQSDPRILIPTDILKTLPPHIVTAMANGLQLNREDRTKSFERLREELSVAPTITMTMDSLNSDKSNKPDDSRDNIKSRKKTDYILVIISCLVSLIILSVVFYVSFFYDNVSKNDVNSYNDSSLNMLKSSSVNNSSKVDIINVPNLVGKDFESVKNEENYQVLVSSEEFNDEIEEGKIISQNPQYSNNAEMKSGSIIAVVVSKGPSLRTLPNISGLSLADASAKLTEVGLVPQKGEEQYSDEYSEGKVIGYSDYSVGDLVKYGSTVRIIISK